MTTTTTEKKSGVANLAQASAAAKGGKRRATSTAKAKAKPAAAVTEKPDHVTTRKGQDGQVCLGACGEWKPLFEYGRTSKARGNRPMRRCRACILAESKARKAAAEKPAEKPAEKKPTRTRKTAKSSPTTKKEGSK